MSAMLLRVTTVVLAMLALTLAACGSGGPQDTNEPSDAQKALKSAVIFLGDDPNNLPSLGNTYDCAINPRRQPGGGQSPLLPVAGSCLWTVTQQGSLWLVTFHETWFCKDWAATAAGYPACDGLTGNHEWQYEVDLGAGTVQENYDRGQFAPDM